MRKFFNLGNRYTNAQYKIPFHYGIEIRKKKLKINKYKNIFISGKFELVILIINLRIELSEFNFFYNL
jgi:hypothetical protein